MSWQAPGVSFSDELVSLSASRGATAVPVFIGYTQRGSANALVAIDSWAEFKTAFCDMPTDVEPTALQASALYQAVKLYFDNGGGSCYVLPAATLLNVELDGSAIATHLKTALNSSALANDTSITLLCVPDIVLLADKDPEGTLWTSIWQHMLDVSRVRPSCFALLDLPRTPALAKMVLDQAVDLEKPEFGAVYWPHLKTRYPQGDVRAVVPPSSAVAAVMQRTDRERGVWKAPANVALMQVVKPDVSHLQVGEVFDRSVQVNLIRSFPGRGVRVWGCRTLTASATSPWRYLQVRRLFSYIEAHLSALGRFCMFEPNNEITWLKLKGLFRGWLRTLWLSGALFGTSEDEAFRLFIGLDESMTADDIQAGRLIMRVELAALYPAEFINLSLRFNVMEAQVQGVNA